MVMEHNWKGAFHGHATDSHLELGAAARAGTGPRTYVRKRCAALLKIADGASAHAVARHGLLKPREPDTVYAWLAHDLADGLAGLRGHRHGGYRRSRLRPRGAHRARAGGG